ncbi:HEPN domain-containing protein [Priestia megaterium]|uniref:HEPN domain-containing protein n=1 Tax=Priestia megaterium TaxID=1404 RepID=UPI0018CF24AF|nr:HEPN domain-containing protein [Priestia megaterium]
MGIRLELWIDDYIEEEEIKALIYDLGFEDSEGENVYLWYKRENFESLQGCGFAFGYDIEKGENKFVDFLGIGENMQYVKTLCRSQTFAGRSYEDLEMQNEVIRKLQDKFGGNIYASTNGKSEFIRNYITKLTPTEKGCGVAYQKFQNNIGKAMDLIQDVDEDIISNSFLAERDRSLLSNNILIPFMVTVLETFLKTFFKTFLMTNKNASEKAARNVMNKTVSLKPSVLKDLRDGKLTNIDVITREYSFQNIPNINAAYNEYLSCNIYEILNKRIDYKGKFVSIKEVLYELIRSRHKIIHEADMDKTLVREKLDKYIFFLVVFGEEFIKMFKKNKGLRLDIRNYL